MQSRIGQPRAADSAAAAEARGDLVTVKVAPFNAESSLERLEPDITPIESFYVRSNFPIPTIDPTDYRLTVTGATRRDLALSLSDLRGLGSRTVVTTMECAGNNRMSLVPLPSGEPWLGGAVSTGRWTGVPLRAVLARAGLDDSAIEILVEGADRGTPKDGPPDIPFARSLPLTNALADDVLLALELNGEPLAVDHGAPIRLVVPGWYGMAGVKWVRRIVALTEPFTGYYQRNRYIFDFADGQMPVPVTSMRVKATIVRPAPEATVAVGPVRVFGRAWSGEGEVIKVEVAVDGGETWRPARLGPSISPYGWRSFEFDWDATDPGRHSLRARATDAAGNVQPASAAWNKYGYGSNGVQVVAVNVR